ATPRVLTGSDERGAVDGRSRGARPRHAVVREGDAHRVGSGARGAPAVDARVPHRPSVAADVLQHGRVTHVTVVPGAGSSDRQDDPGARPVDAVTGCRTEDAVARVAVRARVHTDTVHDPLAGGGVAHDRGRVVVALMGEVEALVR